MIRHLLVAAVCALAGCSSMAEGSLERSWIGKPAREFFSRYGRPTSTDHLNSGDTVYVWHGGREALTRPARADTNITHMGYGHYSATTTYRPAWTLNVGCEVQITADQNGTISEIWIVNDSIGKWWSLSRCMEVL